MIKNICQYGLFVTFVFFSDVVEAKQLKKLKVTATAYTSDPNETDSTPNIAAWGDQLKIGMNVIAVSRDLLTKSKLKYGTSIFINGLLGRYVVMDKMNKRWKNRIDIYMDNDKERAFKWGSQTVIIEWEVEATNDVSPKLISKSKKEPTKG